MVARRWGKENISKYFSELAQQAALASPGGTLSQGPDLLALITSIKATTVIALIIPSSSTVDEKQDKSKGMSRIELNTTLQLCAKASTGDMMDLPAWMQ